MPAYPALLLGSFVSDGTTATITVPEAAVRNYIDLSPAFLTVDGGWTDLTITIDVASGQAESHLHGSVNVFSIGVVTFVLEAQTAP